MINAYYILQDGQQLGPYSHQELMEMGLQPDTMVLSPLADGWRDAGFLPEFAEYFESIGIYAGMSEYAGFWWRLLAYIIDYIIIKMASYLMVALIAEVSAFGDQLFSGIRTYLTIMSLIFLFFTALFYNSFCEATEMQGSFGKKICGLIVVDDRGKRIGFMHAIGRNAGKFISALCCLVGFLMILWDEKSQGLHDKMANTYVMRKR